MDTSNFDTYDEEQLASSSAPKFEAEFKDF